MLSTRCVSSPFGNSRDRFPLHLHVHMSQSTVGAAGKTSKSPVIWTQLVSASYYKMLDKSFDLSEPPLFLPKQSCRIVGEPKETAGCIGFYEGH